MSLEDKVKSYRALAEQIDQLQEQKKSLSTEILQLLSPDISTYSVASYKVRRMVKLTIKTPLEQARLLDAVKTEEVVDKDKIKKMVLQGLAIDGVSMSEFIQVSLLKKETDTVC